MNASARLLLVATMILAASSCAQPESTDTPRAAAEQGRAARGAPPELRELTQGELERYLAFITEMREDTNSVEAELTRDPGRLLEYLTSGPPQGRGAALIETSGLTVGQMAEIHYNMSMAYGAILLDENRSEIEGERVRQQQTIEAMKGKVSDEQLAGMKEAMEAAQSRVANAYAGVPAANKALLRRNGDKLSATFGP